MFFNLKETVAKAHPLFQEAFGEHVLPQKACETWFNRFKSGDFEVSNKERGIPLKKFEGIKLQESLDEDDTQTQKELAEALNVSRSTFAEGLQAVGKIQKQGQWIPHELSKRNMEN